MDTPRTTIHPGLGGVSLNTTLGAQSKPELPPDVTLCSSKDTTTEKNIRATDWEKNLWGSRTRRIMPAQSTYRVFRSGNKNPNNPVKDLKRHFTTEETQVANKHVGRC